MKLLMFNGLIPLLSLIILPSMAIAQNSNTQLSTNMSHNNWKGLYGGFNLGGVINNADLQANHFALINPLGTCDTSSNFPSFFSGAQLGYIYQLESKLVLGFEGDFTYNFHQTGNLDCNCSVTPGVSDHFTIKNRLQGSLRGRLGYSVNSQLLPFVSAGGSFADLETTYSNEGSDYYSKSTTKPGWLVGAGVEWKFFPSWSTRLEYYYVDYRNMHMDISNIYGLYDSNGSAQYSLNANYIRVAVNHWL